MMTAARAGWAIAAGVGLVVLGALLLAFALTIDPVIAPVDGAWLVALASYPVAGALIVGRRSRHGVGWALLAVGALVALAGLADAYAGYALESGAAGAVSARSLQSLLWEPLSRCC